MKRFKLKTIIMTAILLMLATMSAVSAAELNLVYNPETKEVAISGTFSKIKQPATLMILPSSVNKNSLTVFDLNANKYITKQVRSDAEGKINLVLTMNDNAASNEYTVYAVCAGEEASASFRYVKDSDLLGVLAEINRGSKADIEQIFTTRYDEVGLDSSYAVYAGDIAEFIFSLRPAGGYTADSFNAELGRSTAIALIKNSQDINSVIKNFYWAFDLPYDEFEKLDAATVGKLSAVIKSTAMTDSSKKYFYQCLLYAGASSASSYTMVGDIIVGYAAKAGLDITDYNTLGQNSKNNVLAKLYAAKPSDYVSLVSKFNSLVAEAKKSDGNGYGGGGGNGSSSSVNGIAFGSSETAGNSGKTEYDGFWDVEKHWSRLYVEKLRSRGIISGYEDNSFRPDINISKAEFTKMIVDALGLKLTYNNYFDDVTSNKWHFAYISAAKENSIISGFGGKFNPDDSISRQDAAVILYKAFEYKNVKFDKEVTFSDFNSISEYAKEAVKKLAGLGAISGRENGFEPKAYTTRGEAAVMIAKLADLTENETIEKTGNYDEEYSLIAAISDAEKYIPYDTSEKITREAFICALISASGMNEMVADTAFTDVGAGTELHKYLRIAAAYKIVPESENFRSEDTISIDEAAQYCVNMVGYGIAAERAGGYPTGYRRTASSVGILDGVHTSTTLSAADAYKMIFNTINTKFVENQYGSGDEYKVSDSTILSEYLKITKIEGIVTSNEYTEIGSIQGADKSIKDLQGTLGIDGKSYVSNGDFNDFIGYNVRAYIKQDDISDDEVVCLVKRNNREIKLVSGDLTFDGTYITDESTNKDKKYQISPSIDIIVNGKADYTYDLSLVDGLAGDITLVANDNSKEYNVAVINSYSYLKINSYDKSSLVIKDWNNVSKTIELTEDNVSSVYIKGENRYGTFGEIETGTYIAAAVSKDSELCKIVVLSDDVEGVADSVSDDEITIDGKTYKTSRFFAENDQRKLTLGNTVSFYTGVNGEIVAISYDDAGIIYAYLISARYDYSEDSLTLKLYTQNDEMVYYRCADKFRLDGVRNTVELDVLQNTLNQPQLIRFSLNDKKEINVVDLAEMKTGYYDKDVQGLRDNNSLVRNRFASSYYYRQQMFYPYFCIDNSVVFKIPYDLTREDDFEIGYSFPDGDSADGTFVEAYDVGYNTQAGAVIVKVDTTGTSSVPLQNANIIVVEKVLKTINEDNEIVYKISGWKDGKFVTYTKERNTVSKYGDMKAIEPGDILRVNLRGDVITAAVADFIASERAMNVETMIAVAPANCRSTACHYQIGQVYSVKDGIALISTKKLAGNVYSTATEDLKSVRIPSTLAVFDKETRKLRVVDENHIKSYLNSGDGASYLVVQQDFGVSQFGVIYE